MLQTNLQFVAFLLYCLCKTINKEIYYEEIVHNYCYFC